MITSLEPSVCATGRYSPKETCEALGIHRHTLSRYTEQGYIKCGFRRASMRKFYLGSEIVRFWKSQL